MILNRRFAVLCLLAVAALVAFVQGDRLARAFYLNEGLSRADTALRLTVNGLDGHLQRYEALPELLADDPEIKRLVIGADDPLHRARMNLWLKETNAVLQSSDIYVMGMDGTTIAASNFDQPDSFIGQNFTYRPYFTEAAAGKNGRFYAIGTTSGVRGYYFSSPIMADDGRIAGVITFKIGLDALEASWQGGEFRIFVTDPEGIIFMSSDPAWRYTGLLPLTEDRTSQTSAVRRYADAPLRLLPHARRTELGLPLFLSTADGSRHEYLEAAQPMLEAGWTVHALLDTTYLRGQARLAVTAFMLLICVAGFATVLVWQRRARLAERMQMQVQAQIDLERRVDERTADLARVNTQIEQEIAERRLTEQELRRTQADLVQAGKLAALGQMSAALSHEINQPLAAARNYADSAAVLIDRGDHLRARENIGQILSLIDRMAAIAKHLRNVARKPNQRLDDLSLPAVLADAMQIVGTRLASAGADVVIDLAPDLPLVRGGAVRLQQVLVNVLSNAADAVEDCADRRILLTGRVDGDTVAIRIRDHGPGVPPAIAERIFDPFFTTKRVGSGLGLGLSISYNIMKDFGGELRVANDPEGGAVFTLLLQPAKQDRLAAE